MSTIDTSTWSPDPSLNTDIGDIPLNADASIQQTWQAIQMLMAALKGDTSDIKLTINQPDGTTIVATNQTLTVVDNGHSHTIANVSGLQASLDGKAADSDAVHKAGAETVAGAKTFTSQVVIDRNNGSAGGGLKITGAAQNFAISISDTTVKKGTAPAQTRSMGIDFYGQDVASYPQRIGMLECGLSRGNQSSMRLIAYDCSSNTAVNVGILGIYNLNGAVWTEAPTPSSGDSSTKIATTAFVASAVSSASDERLKTSLTAVPEAVLDAWEAVGWGQFKFLSAIDCKGEMARLHLGLIAQRVQAVFEDRGLDACQYGILCRGEDGYWSIRYVEALAMEAVCQRRRADRLEARIAALEEAMNA